MLETLGPKALKYEEFPKIRATLFWGPYNEDPTIWGTILGSPIFGSSHMRPFSNGEPTRALRVETFQANARLRAVRGVSFHTFWWAGKSEPA